MVFAIYLPPQAEPEAALPALYWLSGLTCTDENFMQKAGAQRVAAELGLVLVAPDTSPRGSGVPGDPDGAWDFGLGAGFYLNATQEPWAAHYRMHDYVVHELPALIEAHFPVSRRRGISGHSMGGHGALVCALRNPGATCRCRPSRRSAIRAIVPGARRRSPATWARTRRPGASGMPVRCSRVRPNACRSWSTRASATTSLAVQLKPEALRNAADKAGHPLELRLQPGYDHSYYFIASFIEDHLRHHAGVLNG